MARDRWIHRRLDLRPRALSVLLLSALVAAGCQSERSAADSGNDASVEDRVRELAVEWAAAEAANDVDRTLGLMWEDAVMQPPGSSQVQGHEEIRALYDAVTFVSLDPGPLTVRVGGDLAAVWSPRMTYTLEGPDGTVSDTAKFVAVWERRDGQWKVLENSWSSNRPPAQP